MKLIALLIAIVSGHYLIQQVTDPSSDIRQTAEQIWSDAQSRTGTMEGSWSSDYDCSNAGRPNPSDWAARGGSGVGDAPKPQPLFGRASDLPTAKRQMDKAEEWYEYVLETTGHGAPSTQQARQEYLDAKYHYDALAQQGHGTGGW